MFGVLSKRPPELPGLMAASICIRNKPSGLISIRETTPRVTEMFSPPTGKPAWTNVTQTQSTEEKLKKHQSSIRK
eukprot:3009716-Amphidinium_carterae.1